MTDEFNPSESPNQSPGTAESDAGRYTSTPTRAARDRLLQRAIALQHSSSAESDELLRKARFHSRMDLSGLPCVHDFVRGESGSTLIMRPFEGTTLAEAVIARAHGQPAPLIATCTAAVVTFIKICDAVSAAHARGVVHGALRPECIVFNADREVLVDGWDYAISAVQRPQTTRYVANVPITTMISADGLHEDIRALGLCLFTAVTGRTPAQDTKGNAPSFSYEDQQVIPKPLAAVIGRAMSSSAAEGYNSVADLRGELEQFLAGQVPQVATPGVLAESLHWLQVHRRSLATALLAVVVVFTAALVYYWKDVTTFATWGVPIVDERFDTNAWTTSCDTIGGWEVKEGRLESRAETANVLVFKQRLSPPVAIEYNGKFSSAVHAGDLSIWWCEGDYLAEGAINSQPGWYVQAGAMGNSWCSILKVKENVRTKVVNKVLSPDVIHHFRVEIQTDSLRMWIDDALVLEHSELFPIGSGTLGLYSWDPGKSFDDVRIWQQTVPDVISPLAVGDEAYRAGRFADAVAAYTRVATSHANKPLGIEALYYQGLAQRKFGQVSEAWQTWKLMPDETLRHRAECLAIDDRINAGEVRSAVDQFTIMWNEHPEVRDILRQRWQICGQQLKQKRPIVAAELDAWIKLRDTLFGNDRTSGWLVADMLNGASRWEEVVKRFPDERRAIAPALLSLGRGAEVLAGDWAIPLERIDAYIGIGDLEGAMKSSDITQDIKSMLLCKMGRAEEALQFGPYPALFYLNRITQQLKGNGFPGRNNEALILEGRLEEAAGNGLANGLSSGHDHRAMIMLGRFDEADKRGGDTKLHRMLTLLKLGNVDDAKKIRPSVTGNTNALWSFGWFTHEVGLGLVDVTLGDPAALRNALERGAKVTGAWGGRQALVCSAVLDPAQDAAVLAMPWRSEADAWLLVTRALRAELAQDPAAALKAWQAFATLPTHQRLLDGNFLNLDLESFVSWRLAALSK